MTALVGWLLLFAGAAMPIEEPGVLRILTYNIHHAEGMDRRVDLERIAKVILEAGADVVCLQEVDRHQPRTEQLDFPAFFEQRLGMQGVFESNFDFQGGQYGNATFSRHPIVRHENYPLPNPNGAEPRGCLRVTLNIAGREVDILNTHLGLKPDERLAQCHRLLELVRDVPTILCGDFNEVLTAPGVSLLRTVFTEACPEPPAATFPASKPRRQIDFLFAAHGPEAVACGVRDSELIAVASDHRPVLASFQLPSDEIAAPVEGGIPSP